jgi:hypothetical protein
MRLQGPALAAAGVILISACGSTVRSPSSSPAGSASVDGAQAPAAGVLAADGAVLSPANGVPASTSQTQAAAGALSSGSTPVPRATKAASGRPAGTARSAGPTSVTKAIPAKGPGWDEKHVYVGIITASDAAGALQALGISLNPGDQIADAEAVVADLNAKGGLFGRQVVLIVKDDRGAEVLADPSAAGAADCAYFAQDHPVISVVNTDATLDLDSFRACFAKARIPLITLTTTPFDDQTGAGLAPYFYNALVVSWSRLAPILLTRLQAQSYFGGWNTTTGTASSTTKAKVGVLYGTDTAGSRDGPALVAGLQRAGYATDTFQYSQNGDAASAVLRFAQNGVTHVIGIDVFQFFFMTSARSQHYLPRYGVTTYNAPEALLRANGDPAQLAGAVGVGWYPSLDTDAAHDPGPGPGKADCLAALAKGGQSFEGKRFAEAVAMAECDGIHLAVYGAKAGGGLDPVTVRAGIVKLGASFPTGGGFASGLSSTNFAMPGAGRDLGWDAGCSCFSYRGATYGI